MRLAVLSDVHGNAIALEAVLNDIAQRGGADQHLLLGDLAAIGGDPGAAFIIEWLSGQRRPPCAS